MQIQANLEWLQAIRGIVTTGSHQAAAESGPSQAEADPVGS